MLKHTAITNPTTTSTMSVSPQTANHEKPQTANYEKPQTANHEQPQTANHEQPQTANHEKPQTANHEQPQQTANKPQQDNEQPQQGNKQPQTANKPQQANKQFSRLALVSHVLYEREIVELRQKNEELELKLFWKDHCAPKLLHAICSGNSWFRICNCEECRLFQRYSGFVQRSNCMLECHFMEWFAGLLQGHGLTSVDNNATWVDCPHIDGTDGSPLDVHFVNATGEWDHILYGTRLTNAKHVNDPELKKLKALFEVLEQPAVYHLRRGQ